MYLWNSSLNRTFLFWYRMSQRNGPQGALKPLKRKVSPLLSSVFPILCCIARQRMLVYSPDCMPGGQKQITEWRRLLRQGKTSRDVEKLTVHWPRFVFAYLQCFKSLSLVQSNNKQPVLKSVIQFSIREQADELLEWWWSVYKWLYCISVCCLFTDISHFTCCIVRLTKDFLKTSLNPFSSLSGFSIISFCWNSILTTLIMEVPEQDNKGGDSFSVPLWAFLYKWEMWKCFTLIHPV